MDNNEEKPIQLKIERACTQFLLYNSQKYPINFDLFKYSSKYFYERRHEIPEDGDIDITKYDPDDNISYFSPDEVIDFIKYIQVKPIQLTNNNVVTLQYFGHKYDIKQLITSTEKYINDHEDEIMLKFLKRKELLSTVDLSFYEDKISSNFSIYLNNDDILSLDINILYRILEKVSMNNDKELKSSSMKNFLMKVLDKHGRPASILFQYADISAFDDETLALLLTKYSKVFEFEYITSSVLNSYLTMKKEHLKYEEESKKKHESIVKEHQEQKNNNEISSLLERERQEHLKYKEESNKKYEIIVKELQEQKNNNDKMNKQLLKYKVENEQLRKKQKDKQKEHDELIKELDKHKKQIISMKDSMKDQNEKHSEYNSKGTISICKYSENMIISNKSDKDKVNNLRKYLINKKKKYQKKTNSDEKVQEILFIKLKEATTTDNDNV